jgi:hypothetical protein
MLDGGRASRLSDEDVDVGLDFADGQGSEAYSLRQWTRDLRGSGPSLMHSA